MKIGVLALQGAFAEHEKVLEQLGAKCIELRQARDLGESYDALVLPGGESTVQGKLLKELGMFDIMKSQIENGMPVLATCAGAILLAEKIDGQIKGQPEQYFGTIPMCIMHSKLHRLLHHAVYCGKDQQTYSQMQYLLSSRSRSVRATAPRSA